MSEDHEMQLEGAPDQPQPACAPQDHIAAGLAKQREIIKAMTAEQKLKIAFDMRRMAMELKTSWLKQIHPDWTEQQVQAEVRRIFLYAQT